MWVDFLLLGLFASLILTLVLYFRRTARVWRRDEGSPWRDEQMIATLIGDADWDTLTEREKQVARHVSAGKSNKEVAQALGISTQTVSSHLKRIYRKMDVQSRWELATRVREVDH